jgi:hypothetical protein
MSMNAVLASICATILMMGAAIAQDGSMPPQSSPTFQAPTSAPAQPPTQSQPDAVTRLAAGSVIPVSLNKTIDAKKVKTGDEVVTTVTQDMKSTDGKVLIAKDTKVMGHVTEAQPRNKEQKESQIAIVFDHAVMKDGGQMQMPMSIQAIIAPPNTNPGNANGGGNAGYDQASPSSSPGPGMSSNMPGRSSGMGTNSTPTPSTTGVSDTSGAPSNGQAASNGRPPVTASTQGVVGISNLNLAAPSGTNQGSVVSSDKNNVKLESGTVMLLRVNQ